jgi:hypothetical protein
MIRLMVLASLKEILELYTKDFGRTTSSMAKEKKPVQMDLILKGTIGMGRKVEKENIVGVLG